MRNLADVSWTHHLRNQSMPVGSRSLLLKVGCDTKQGPRRPGHALCNIVCRVWQSWRGVSNHKFAHKLKTWSSCINCINMKERADLVNRFGMQLLFCHAPYHTKYTCKGLESCLKQVCRHLILHKNDVAHCISITICIVHYL